ncbi:uncharacterized protein LOC144881459 [Branchiostoma floridae x Branchiostoma japonicum]
MSGARPKVYARRSSSSSSDENTGALCHQSDSGELAISSRDAQAYQDDLQLSLACQQPGTVQGISYTGHVEGRDNVLLQPGANCELTFNSPLIQHTYVTYGDGTVVTSNDGEEGPRHQTHSADIDRLDDIASLANIPMGRPRSNVRRPQPQLPSTEQLEWLKWHLKRLYRTKLGEFQPLPWFDDLHLQLKDVYTNLQIVRKDRADRDLPFRRSGRGETGKRFGSNVRDSRDDSGLIRIEQIFDVNRNGEILRTEDQGGFQDEDTEKPKRIRIEGPPGIGKSIQCRKLACDWSSDLFQQFDFAFLLQMRYFSGDVKDAVFDQLLPEDTDIDKEGLWSYIRQTANQPKVLFILDGLDELKPQVRQTSDVIKLIQQRVMTDATVVATSRPHECTADLKGCPLHCNITGYTKANSQEYIHKYFSRHPHLANSLGSRIARDKNLVELATNPLNTMLLCIVWEDNDGSLPSTITGLFSSLVLCIVKRYCSKNDIAVAGTEIPGNVTTQLVEMGRVAWEGLLRNEVNFDEADFQSMTRGIEMFKLGFLTKDLGASRIEASFVWSFLHKTFQEYFAAVCLSKDAAAQEGLSGSVSTGMFEFIPHQLFLVEPRVRRLQANVSLTGPIATFKERVLRSLKDDNLHQVCLFLVGILKTRARAVFECFRSRLLSLQSSGDSDAKDQHRALFLFCIKCLIESDLDLVRVLYPCFPKTIDVSDLFAQVDNGTWRLCLPLILNAECPSVTRVDINLSTHPMTKEVASALVRNRFVTHLSITKVELDDMSVSSLNTEEQEDAHGGVPLWDVLTRAQSIRVFFAQILELTTSDRDSTLMAKLFRAMSICTPLSSIILKLHMAMEESDWEFPGLLPDELRLPVDLLASSSTLSTFKLWIYGTLKHHSRTEEYYESDSDGGGVYGGVDELEGYVPTSVDDQAFNESFGKLLCESKTIKTFSLWLMYRCTVFRHAKNFPCILANMLSVTEVLRHIVLHFSFYHKQKGRDNPITYKELTRFHIFKLVEALAQNRTLRTFELFIDDDVGVSRNKEDCSSEEDEATEQPCQAGSNQSQTLGGHRLKKADQDCLWPSIASVFQCNTVLHELILTFKYCLTESPESVQRMANAILALSGNSTLHTVKLSVILYRAKAGGRWDTSVSGIENVDEVFRALGNVVSTNTTLRCLHFHKADDPWRRASRERVSTMVSQNDKTWQVSVSKSALEQLASSTQRNMVLREFSVMGFRCEDEVDQELVDEMFSPVRGDLDITFSIY